MPVPTTAAPDLADHTGVTGDLADMRRRAAAASKAATGKKDTCLEKANAALETSLGEHTKTKQWFVNDATGKFTTSTNSLKVAYETAMDLAKGQTENATKVFAGATEKLYAAKLRVRTMMRERRECVWVPCTRACLKSLVHDVPCIVWYAYTVHGCSSMSSMRP